jgi:SulP family sulfate permease
MKLFSFLQWLPEYKKPGVIRADVLAGLTGAIVVLPQGIAFALLAGMPAHYGLYAAMVPCLIAALFGSSRLMVTGPANAISLTTMALIAPLALPESPQYVVFVLTLSFLVGVIQLTLGFSGVGKWVEKVPHSVIVGFTAGAAVLIINSQVGTLLGINIPQSARMRTLSRWLGFDVSVFDVAFKPSNPPTHNELNTRRKVDREILHLLQSFSELQASERETVLEIVDLYKRSRDVKK